MFQKCAPEISDQNLKNYKSYRPLDRAVSSTGRARFRGETSFGVNGFFRTNESDEMLKNVSGVYSPVRVRKAEVVHTAASKEGRLSRRMERSTQNEFFEEEEGRLYGPGIAD